MAEPFKIAIFGSVMVCFGPAFTIGALLTVTRTESLPESVPSFAVSVSV